MRRVTREAEQNPVGSGTTQAPRGPAVGVQGGEGAQSGPKAGHAAETAKQYLPSADERGPIASARHPRHPVRIVAAWAFRERVARPWPSLGRMKVS